MALKMKFLKRQLYLIIPIFISGLLTYDLSTFYNPITIITLPGLLFGLAVTIPSMMSDFCFQKRRLIIGLAYPVVWFVSLALTFFFLMITTKQADKLPYIIIGLLSGLGVSITFDWQFGLKKRVLGITIVTLLSITAILLGDFLFPSPHGKELNTGKQIAIWETLVGIGLILNKKEKTGVNVS